MMRVLHAPVNVGNQPWVLSRHERKQGIHSDLIVNYATWLEYPADRVLSPYGSKKISDLATRLAYGLASPLRYDVLHYYFGRSLLCWDDLGSPECLEFLDMKIAKKLGRRIFFTLQGCDVRLARESNLKNSFTACAEGKCTAYEACLSTYDARRRYLIDKVLKSCDQVFFLNPELGHYVRDGSFLPYASVELDSFEVAPPKNKGVIRIVHAPSDPALKGTKLIVQALEKLKNEYDFELIMVQGRTHRQALEIYKQADLAIDQVLCGWYGGVAVELMAMGKPVLCYIRDEDMEYVPAAMQRELPIQRLYPDRLAEDIAKVLECRNEWRDYSAAAREYVYKWHNPSTIARAMVKMYESPDMVFDIQQWVN